ncbi:hypothetical protein MKQ68_02460 [Chitinophaga horti]|uniref:Zinc finger domain-containing protein, LSD1 subclass n=1 Tax=Chitinophaga horti TaxID=2920382 RepID=A0ABY6J6N6_9BACT|nr:hypothetical protein [Chitinophaga horti]UYQ93956.1 hypothetical protein MKQ68_02460 [Chitinophaga horti]
MEQPSLEKKDPLLLFPCPGCNAQLHFDPGGQQLECEHCGTRVAIERGTDQIRENNLHRQMVENTDPATTIEQQVYKCNRCSAETIFTSETPTFICAFCNFEVVNPVAYKTRIIQPSGIIPFVVDKQQSVSIFKTWLGKGFWAPNDLAQFARQDALHGMYLPFWTYDAQTNSHWTGYGGRYYWETEYFNDAQGKRQSRQVRRTEWIYRSGTYDRFFDDVLIGGTNELTQQECYSIFPYDLKALINFDARYLSGWQADVYDVAVGEGYTQAEAIMRDAIHDACAEQCRIDTYRDLNVNTQYSAQTYKHVLLPIWLCSYFYKNKKYHFLVNGQTGRIHGKKPVSAGKVVLAVLLALIVVAGIIYAGNQ